MASVFIRAENTGIGFITREDRIRFTISGVLPDIYEVSGEYEDWVTRVSGSQVSQEEVDQLLAEAALINESNSGE